MKVIKRDGRKVAFQEDKVKIAVLKAFLQVDGETTDYARDKADTIAKYINDQNRDLSVEEIQDMVEAKLMACNRKDVAKTYIIYRNDRDREREKNSSLMKKVGSKIKANNVQNQNANVDEKSFGGRIGEASGQLLRQYAIDNLLSDLARNNHLNNEIYIHDLDHYAVGDHNCLSIPFDKLLAEGFNTRQTDVRPAQSVSTAFQLVAVIFQLQSLQQFGGVSATHLDWTMVPYVRKSFWKHYKDGLIYVEELGVEDYENGYITDDLNIEDDIYKKFPKAYKYAMDMTTKEVYQAVEGMYHNLK